MADDPKLSPASQSQIESATVAEKLANARKAIADASSAESAASMSGLKAAIGEPAAGPYSGSVEAGDGAAAAELNLLARRQLQTLASALATAIAGHVAAGAAIWLTSGDGPPDFSHDAAVDDRFALVEAAAESAKTTSDDAMGEADDGGGAGGGPGVTTRMFALAPLAFAPVAAAGLVLGGVNSLLGYLKTDYKISGTALTPGDRVLLIPLAQSLQTGGRRVWLAASPPAPSDGDRAALRERLSGLSQDVAVLRARIAVHKAAAAPKDRDDDPEGRGKHEQALAACMNAVDLFDALTAFLYADAGGVPVIERALGERRLRAVLGGTAVVVAARIDGAWGTAITTKNLFSGLWGKLPVQVSATAAASWAAYALADGRFIAGDTLTAGSGLLALADVQAGPPAAP